MNLLCCFQGVGVLKITAKKFAVTAMLLTLCLLIGIAGFWYADNWPGSYSLHNVLSQGYGSVQAVANPGDNKTVVEPPPPEITISLVGDVLLAAGVEKYIQSQGFDYPWRYEQLVCRR